MNKENTEFDIIKSAIADAKAVRATAIANAKAFLEESFNQQIKAVLADKLREDTSEEQPVPIEQPVDETVDPKDATPSKNDGTKDWGKNGDPAAKPTTTNITPNTVPAPKDGGDGTKNLSKDNKGSIGGTPQGVKENTETTTTDESVEEVATNEDLEEIIRELEAEVEPPLDDTTPADDATVPPPTPGETDVTPDVGTPAPPTGGPIVAGEPVIIQPASAAVPPTSTSSEVPSVTNTVPPTPDTTEQPNPEGMEEEIDINELLASLNEEKEEKEEEEKEEKEEEDKKKVDESSELVSLQGKLNESYKTIQYLRDQINEINLLNAKLLYTNKLFKEFGVNRDQKIKIVEAFDLTKNVREVKLTYANWCESLNFGGNLLKRSTPSTRNTITEGLASKPVASTKPAEIITESANVMAERFKKLAGIPSKK